MEASVLARDLAVSRVSSASSGRGDRGLASTHPCYTARSRPVSKVGWTQAEVHQRLRDAWYIHGGPSLTTLADRLTYTVLGDLRKIRIPTSSEDGRVSTHVYVFFV